MIHTLFALSAQLNDRLVQRQVSMNVSSSLVIVFVAQCCLHTLCAEFQIQNIISALDDLIQPGLERQHQIQAH